MPLIMEVGLSPGHIVLDGDPSPQKGHTAELSVHVFCGQMAVWIEMPLVMEVDLSLGHIVLDGDPVPPPLTGHNHPKFQPMSGGLRCDLVWR